MCQALWLEEKKRNGRRTIDNWRHQCQNKVRSKQFLFYALDLCLSNLSVIMDFSSILLFIFILIIQIHLNLSLWKKSSDSLEEYVIDVLFSNSLTIIRCNPYELQVFREISIETVGYIRCTNRNLFLPENHLESITLLQWNYTSVECQKNKKAIIEERTYLYVKHKAKHAFKKVDLNLIRVGSMGSSQSKMDEKNYLLSFKHPPRSLAMITLDQENENYTVDTFAFKHRPILCRERQLVLPGGPCTNQHLNLSYVCYYRVS